MSSEVDFRFLVEVNTDGTILVHPEIPQQLEASARSASPLDIVRISKQLSSDIERQILTENIVGSVIAALTPQPEPTAPEVIREALKERGITPEQGTEDSVD